MAGRLAWVSLLGLLAAVACGGKGTTTDSTAAGGDQGTTGGTDAGGADSNSSGGADASVGGATTGGRETAGAAGEPVPTGGASTGGEPPCPDGDEGCACYGNETCNDDLICASNLCVRLPTTGGTGGVVGAAGAGNTAGTDSAAGVGNAAGAGNTAGAANASTSGGTGGAVACEARCEPAQPTPLNIVFIIDKSGSMGAQDVDGDGWYDGPNEWDNTAYRWDPIKTALTDFFTDPGIDGLQASLEFFPLGSQPTGPDTGVCSIEQYQYPAAPMTSLGDETGVELLVGRLEEATPSGGTPTLPALQGTIEYARRTIAENPGSQSVVVLVTDGLPGVGRLGDDGNVYNDKCFCYGEPGCSDQDEIPYVAYAAHAAADEGILTFVIGMGEVDPSNLDVIAVAGGTEAAFIVSLGDPAVTAQMFSNALASVSSTQTPCEFELPEPPAGEPFDPTLVNIEFVAASRVTTLVYAGPRAAASGGIAACLDADADPPWYWTYDIESDPTKIMLCDSACSAVQSDETGTINVTYGCELVTAPL